MMRLLGFAPQRERFSDAGGAFDADALERQPLASSSAAAASATTGPASSAAAAVATATAAATIASDDGSLVVRMLRQADESLYGGGRGGGGSRPGSPSPREARDGATAGPRRPPPGGAGNGGGSGSASAVVSLTAMSASSHNALAAAGNGHHHHGLSLAKKPQQQQQQAGAAPIAGGDGPAAPASAAAAAAPASTAAAVVYGLANLSSVVAIVVANKFALKTHGFAFPVALTWCHTAFTAAGMAALARAGFFAPRRVARARSAPVAAVYVASLVLNNLSIQLNTVGFYQVSKIAITPAIVAIERACYGKRASPRVLAATGVLLCGVLHCSSAGGGDGGRGAQLAAGPVAALVAAANVLVSALYQVWASTKQRELGVDGMQLLHQISGPAVLMLGVLVPAVEPVGWAAFFGGGGQGGPGGAGAAAGATSAAAAAAPSRPTLATFDYTPAAVFWIALSSVLGLVVTATTLLFIGATSSLTYNVVGHLKTVAIVAAGVLLFGDGVGARRVAGLALAMGGILWYSRIKVQEQQQQQGQQQQGQQQQGQQQGQQGQGQQAQQQQQQHAQAEEERAALLAQQQQQQGQPPPPPQGAPLAAAVAR